MTPIIAVGFELWTVTEDVYFDNIIITSELTVANNFAYERSVQRQSALILETSQSNLLYG